MRHVLVLAPGDEVELHWQQMGLRATVTEILKGPQRADGVRPLPRRVLDVVATTGGKVTTEHGG